MKHKTIIQLLSLAITLLFVGCTQEKEPIAVTGVTLSQTSLEMTEGDTQTLSATIQPSNAENKSVSWTSSNSSVASVQEGVVTAHKAGSTTITIKTADGGKTATCSVTVTAKVIAVASVSLDKTSIELTEGDETTLTAIITPDNATNKNVTWTSSDATVATVDNGKVTAIKEGTATITVTTKDGNKSATCIIMVFKASANCYIVSKSGEYNIRTVKGNSTKLVGDISSAAILWESYGTDTNPSVGDLINNITYSDNIITFNVNSPFKEGNAVIVAKDADEEILWSWHIWLTDYPEEVIYSNNAGILMDRNLGATSATPGDVGSLGLLYQWGRKDPFLGSSSISENNLAKSTYDWPVPEISDANIGTINYSISHPTTYIIKNNRNSDWFFTGTDYTENNRWQEEKTIYDPCPSGWKVPDGDSSGFWSRDGLKTEPFDEINKGYLVDTVNPQTTWYPLNGKLDDSGKLAVVGINGRWWSTSLTGMIGAGTLYLSETYIRTSYGTTRDCAHAIRCMKE